MTAPAVAAALDRYLAVETGGEWLALPAATVVEVVRPRPLSRVPHAPDALLGVASLRGAVLPVLSLARLRGTAEPDAAVSATARLVVLAADSPFALQVDAVATLGDGAGLPRVDPAELVARTLVSARSGASRRAAPAPMKAPDAAPAPPALAVLGFTVAGQLFGLALRDVVEVTPVPADAVLVPEASASTIGVAARRGALLPLVSARALLGRPAAGTSADGRVIVVRVAGADLGLVVDSVAEILRVPEEAVEPLPALLARRGGEARVAAVCRLDDGRRLLSLLSADRLFDDDTMRRVLAAAPIREDAMVAASGAEGDGAERFVVFDLGGEPYALPIASVDEVVRLPDVLTRVPRAPAFVEGVMNLRGTVVPVVDAARRFGAAPAPAGSRRRVLVVSVGGLKAGLIVDGVSEVLAVAPGELSPAPDLAGDEAGTFDRIVTIARDDRLILVVSPEALLQAAERDILAALASAGPAP